jgi:hypothetical protein
MPEPEAREPVTIAVASNYAELLAGLRRRNRRELASGTPRGQPQRQRLDQAMVTPGL